MSSIVSILKKIYWKLRFGTKLFMIRDEGTTRLYHILGINIRRPRKYDPLQCEEEAKDILCRQMIKYGNKYTPDLEHPRTFNEKMQWLKLYYHNPLLTICADKYTVRQYITDTVGSQYLIDLLGVYERVEDIDIDALPDQFVLKVNWGSGQNIICRDKSQLDWEAAKEQLRIWMQPQSNHYFNYFEWGYKNIPPRIICEKYVQQMGGDLWDYKLYCFNGKVRFVHVVTGRGTEDMQLAYYDLQWKQIPVICYHYVPIKRSIPRPVMFDDMIALAEKLVAPFPFLRVDFYVLDDVLKIGELTCCPWAGVYPYEPEEWDFKFGEMLTLPEEKWI